MPPSLETDKAQTVEYKLFKKMPRNQRVCTILGFLLVGILLQLFTVWWSGIPLVFFGVLLGLCEGVTNKPKELRFGKWENVTIDEFRKAQEMFEKTAQWGRDKYELMSCLGCSFFLFLLAILVGIGFLVLSYAGDENSCFALVADGFLALFLVFVTGRRQTWEPEGLKIKLEPLLNVCRHLQGREDLKIEISPMLELQGKGEEKTPRDCKMMLKFPAGPKDFIGIQVQTSLNDVRGAKFPYMYCVLLAKPGSGLVKAVTPRLKNGAETFGFFSDANDKKNPDLHKKRYLDAVVETKTEKDIELVVVRQKTFGTGYHTDAQGQILVFNTAMSLAKEVYGL